MPARGIFAKAGLTVEDADLLETVFNQTAPLGEESDDEKRHRAALLAELFVKGTTKKEMLIAMLTEGNRATS